MMPPDTPSGLKPRNTQRGRPQTTGQCPCARCGRRAGKFRAHWPEGGICFTTAMRVNGICPRCKTERLLPGPINDPDGPMCADCAGIGADFHCRHCGAEGEIFRRGICARCALRDELSEQILTNAPPENCDAAGRLVEALCAAVRPKASSPGSAPPRSRASSQGSAPAPSRSATTASTRSNPTARSNSSAPSWFTPKPCRTDIPTWPDSSGGSRRSRHRSPIPSPSRSASSPPGTTFAESAA